MIQKLLRNRWLFCLYLLAIILLVTLPLNSSGELNNITIVTFRGDYFFHALAFIPWFFFKPVFTQVFHTWLILGLLFASGSEGLQYLLPYLAFNINDLFANMIGILIGCCLALVLNYLLKKLPNL
jgi:glycopeptide antibiotics resistance protein